MSISKKSLIQSKAGVNAGSGRNTPANPATAGSPLDKIRSVELAVGKSCGAARSWCNISQDEGQQSTRKQRRQSRAQGGSWWNRLMTLFYNPTSD